MNKDQVTGAAKNIGGKLQQKAGKLVGSEHQQAQGIKHQVQGKLQEKAGDIKDALKTAGK
jgi:uncharacterized protein YjbJ (UPF0337 family)